VWVQKLKEKQEAAKKAKLLEEMDQMIEDDVVASSKSKTANKKYTSNHLKGLRIEHDELMFREEQDVILTLKDRRILTGTGEDLAVDEDEDADVLVNVNLMDDERAKKNVENRKARGKDYKPYDDEFDEDGNFRQRDLLDKYNEELEGEKKKSFRLGAKGMYDASDAKMIAKMNEDFKAKAVRLGDMAELELAKDYYTSAEMEAFKKPKKLRKVMRASGKSRSLKADDLLPLPSSSDVKQEPHIKQ
jgi:U4/U6.U5 tri-snRNP-associated protein 1